MSNWYEKCMPRIKDISPHLDNIIQELKHAQGVKSIYVWGSYARNINKPNFRIKDIDILARTKFHSGDLLSIDKNITTEISTYGYLENQGYDPLAVAFSREFVKLGKHHIDHWVISSDRKLLHWGPVSTNRDEADSIRKEAEDYAFKQTGLNRNKVNKSSETSRQNWYKYCYHFMDKQFEDMPTGWYKTEDIRIKDILSEAIKL